MLFVSIVWREKREEGEKGGEEGGWEGEKEGERVRVREGRRRNWPTCL